MGASDALAWHVNDAPDLADIGRLAVAWWTGVVLIGCVGLSVARTRYAPPYDEPMFDGDEEALGVTILRPLSGLDNNLYENLEASFRQRYPAGKVEILFCVAREDDQAVAIARTLMRAFPDVDARLLIGETDVGVNPKVNNLARAYREAKHDLVWIVDSNVLTSFGTLARSVVAIQQPRIGLVHHLPFALFGDSELGSGVENAFLGTQHAKMYLAINWFAVDSCLMGKSTLFRRSELDRATSQYKYTRGETREGIECFGAYLGEDNMIGSALWWGLGLRHAMTSDLAGNTVGAMTVRQYFWRRVRWIRIRKYMVTAATLAEPFQESIVCSTLFALGLRHLVGIPVWLTLVLAIGLWHVIDVGVYSAVVRATPAPMHRPLSQEVAPSPEFALAWLVREVLALPIWLVAIFGGDTVSWRADGQLYHLRRDGKVELRPAASRGEKSRAQNRL